MWESCPSLRLAGIPVLKCCLCTPTQALLLGYGASGFSSTHSTKGNPYLPMQGNSLKFEINWKRSVTCAKSHSNSTALTSCGNRSTINTTLERLLGWQGGVSPSISVGFIEKHRDTSSELRPQKEALLALKCLEYLSHVTVVFRKSGKPLCSKVHSKGISTNKYSGLVRSICPII